MGDIWQDCAACGDHLATAGSSIIAACASVGIEEKMTTRDMARVYFDGYHRDNHRPQYQQPPDTMIGEAEREHPVEIGIARASMPSDRPRHRPRRERPPA